MEEAIGASIFLLNHLENITPKKQAFKRSLDLTFSIKGAEGVGNLILSMPSEF